MSRLSSGTTNQPLFSSLPAAKIGNESLLQQTSLLVVIDAWSQAKSWLVGRYVIMPDHIHLFCAPGVFPREAIAPWVRFWKNLASRKWPRPNEQPVWQRDFWDTQLRRRHESYRSKWEYVVANPVRAGLVTSPKEWPFQGELNLLRW